MVRRETLMAKSWQSEGRRGGVDLLIYTTFSPLWVGDGGLIYFMSEVV